MSKATGLPTNWLSCFRVKVCLPRNSFCIWPLNGQNFFSRFSETLGSHVETCSSATPNSSKYLTNCHDTPVELGDRALRSYKITITFSLNNPCILEIHGYSAYQLLPVSVQPHGLNCTVAKAINFDFGIICKLFKINPWLLVTFFFRIAEDRVFNNLLANKVAIELISTCER